MSTPYENIYARFMQKITDYSFDNLVQSDAEEILLGYLRSAIPKFTTCNNDLTKREDINQIFNIELSELEEEILAQRMLLEWVRPMINHTYLMKSLLNTKDFQVYSQANQLRQLNDMKKDIEDEIDRLTILYSYNNGLEELR